MANDEHLAILREGVAAWNAWREGHPNVRPDLSEAHLAGAHLERANLTAANLAGAHLTGANLARANLEGADLARADLRGANLKWANLAGAHLERANLTAANLEGAHLTGADLEGANLAHANLARADLEGADLARANLAGADLARANLEGANLEGADLKGANLEGAFLVGAKRSTGSDGDLALLTIPLHLRVPARDLGLILNGLADLYAVALEEGGEPCADTLIAHRIAVGTPNEVELIGMLPQITAIAAALVAVLKVPKALGEGAERFAVAAEKLAAARKTWIEGTLLKEKIGKEAQAVETLPEATVTRIEVAFNALAQGKEIISGEPKHRIVAVKSAQDENNAQADETPGHA